MRAAEKALVDRRLAVTTTIAAPAASTLRRAPGSDHDPDRKLRRWAVHEVLANGCFETFHGTTTVCRLATELVEYVNTGVRPEKHRPDGARLH
jgi:hypothetical protein